jgi:ribA/ribD-fused uncharacterized protein
MPNIVDVTSLLAACAEGFDPNFIFFWGSPPKGADGLGPWMFSQWAPSPFTVDGIKYATSEHWMMAGKARTFGDGETLHKILEDSQGEHPSPKLAKAWGREVRGFTQEAWERVAFGVVTEGNVHKFGQNPKLGAFLQETGERVLVEASPYDTVWGIGLAVSDVRSRSPHEWRGRNLLGFAIMQARTILGGGYHGSLPEDSISDTW